MQVQIMYTNMYEKKIDLLSVDIFNLLIKFSGDLNRLKTIYLF